VTVRVALCVAVLLALVPGGAATGAAASAKVDPGLASVASRGGAAKVIVDVATPAEARKMLGTH